MRSFRKAPHPQSYLALVELEPPAHEGHVIGDVLLEMLL